jgi:Activator of Hsp90 ATPase homolog 1-like protein
MSQNFGTAYSVDQTPEEVFAAINDVPGWWTGEIVGGTDKLGDEFTYRYKDIHYSKQKITELIPGEKVVWRVTDAHLNFPDPAEWIGTDITFEVSREGGQTRLRFAHVGLVPEFECFDNCSSAWSSLVNGNLRRLITAGERQPS